MKMNKKLLLTASVFFVLVALIGCGVATIFFYKVSHTEEKNQPNTVVKGKFEFVNEDLLTNDPLKMITMGTGPSLLIGYTVTDTVDRNPFNNKFITEFNSRYRKDGHFGRAVSSSEILSVTNEDTQYSLYQLSDSGGEVFRSPLYVASAKNPLQPDCEYTLTLQDDNTLKLEVIEYNSWNSDNLCRYNGQIFETTISSILTNATKYPDYSLPTSSSTLYIHLYGAMNVSEGDFSNIFWSPLSYLGTIQLL
jgi:hypothetical protein